MKIEKIATYFQNGLKKHLKKGDILYREGDSPTGIYLIESGLIGLFHLAPNGKETFLRVFDNENTIGHRSFFAKELYHATSMALAPTIVRYLSKDQFEKMINDHPEILREILEKVSIDLGNAELRMSGHQDKTAAGRIIESIVFLKLKYPTQVWTRKLIADFSGSTIETVTRVLNKLEKTKDITKQGRDFSIIDPSNLLKKINQF